ncbi:sigma-70 family RNA polymerase sigma factor [Calycomorphotria hydatis]|uniref:ECF RNA polymerase sigma factor SigH n=1 Tax=Calycomorphotria hydatis TaxID=2528027 RepID=A0A517T6N2_9PLAN|nr:sigma-70 family RNA polymerase sigma factor [Calycomorphotria hydatis]QDT64017.1 ECF RNA polymerase sigma factor SigH [Calycomorphotria hydatis]
MNESAEKDQASAEEEFIRLFTRGQRRLFLYILSQVGNPHDAEEILQEANVIIWRKSSQFEAGSNFHAWTTRIALFEVLKYRERQSRNKVQFSSDFVEAMANIEEEDFELEELQRNALATCLQKLKQRDRELIEHRYAPGANGKSIAADLGRPVNAVYQSLSRVRRTLLECINREVKAAVEYPSGSVVQPEGGN